MENNPNEVELNGKVYVLKESLPKQSKTANVKTIQKHPYTIGKQWIIETATKYYVGDVVAVTDTEIILSQAAWLADTGRFNEFMKTGVPLELEPCGAVVVSRGAIVASLPSPMVKIEVK
jgi:phosphoribosyl 1,2-cyclic phosphodiesterase